MTKRRTKDNEIVVLHRYWVWANRMKLLFDEELRTGKSAEESIKFFEPFMFYWYGSLYVVVEGWHRLGLDHPQIDALLDSPNVALLKQFRHGTFHYQPQYYTEKFLRFIRDGQECVPWIRELHSLFGKFFLDWHDRNAQR